MTLRARVTVKIEQGLFRVQSAHNVFFQERGTWWKIWGGAASCIITAHKWAFDKLSGSRLGFSREDLGRVWNGGFLRNVGSTAKQ